MMFSGLLKLKRFKLWFLTGVVVTVLTIVLLIKNEDGRLFFKQKVEKPKDAIKRILYWHFKITRESYNRTMVNLRFRECPVSNCEIWDTEDMMVDLPVERYDALIFHGIVRPDNRLDDLPLARSPHQRYIFKHHDPPTNQNSMFYLDNFYNWTSTYRRDSDIYHPYFEIRDRKDTSVSRYRTTPWMQPTFIHVPQYIEMASKKTKLVAWFVSNVHPASKRDVYVKELSKYIKVDVYGRGGYQCTRNNFSCNHMLETTYKFYLAFENSFCADYVTEKFQRALKFNVIPVVYGAADYSSIAPPMSYINVKDFESPKHLAEYLLFLDKNPQEYVKYFWWKEFYKVGIPTWYCELCEKLNNPSEPVKTYPSVGLWWKDERLCFAPNEFARGVNFDQKKTGFPISNIKR